MQNKETKLNQSLSYTPASFEKRVAAWVGVVYMLMLTAAMTYIMSTGKVLTGIAPLLLPPAAVGVAIIVIYRHRKGISGTNRYFVFAMFFLCVVAFLLGLGLGIPALLANFYDLGVSFVVTSP